MAIKLGKSLSELVAEEVINQETAERIQAYYQDKKQGGQSRLLLAFGILGAVLIGLGLILIIAHNWDDLGKSSRTIISFLPLVASQVLCGYVLWKRPDQVVWKESVSVLLFFSIGGCISLIGQIYQVPGDLRSFLFTWMLVALPIVYVMRSSMVSLLYIVGVSYYGIHAGYFRYPPDGYLHYWWLLLLALPYYIGLWNNRPTSNFVAFHHWSIALSLVICLGTINQDHGAFLYVAYVSLFALYYQIGKSSWLANTNLSTNAYLVIGTVGTVIVLLVLSFDWFWLELGTKSWTFNSVLVAPEGIAAFLTTLAALGVWLWRWQGAREGSTGLEPTGLTFLVFIPLFFWAWYGPTIPLIAINLLVFLIGVYTIWKGAVDDHLVIMNTGLLILTGLVVCRFFDADLTFITRGVLFVLIGTGFFIVNYRMVQKRKADAQ